MNLKRSVYLFAVIGVTGFAFYFAYEKPVIKTGLTVGEKVDELNGISVFYNGKVSHVSGRNISNNGYNLGLKFQCVEFVKRYYHDHLDHKMPDTYGHAKDFFDNRLADGSLNKRRDLMQYSNPGKTKPQLNDLLIFDGSVSNKYGHVAIVSKVSGNAIEIVQQNPGPYGKSRVTYSLTSLNGGWNIENNSIIGWLRKQ